MKPSDLLLFTATLALIACSKSDAAKDAAATLPASTQDSAATAAAVAPVAVPAAVPAAPPASAGGSVAKPKPAAVVAPNATPSVAAKSVVPVATTPAPQPAPASAPPVAAPVAAAAAPTENAADGKAIYTENCQKCHGATGTPAKAMKAKFDKLSVFDPAFFANRSLDSVVTVLIKGKGTGMKSFEGKLSAGEMRAVAAYVRSFGR